MVTTHRTPLVVMYEQGTGTFVFDSQESSVARGGASNGELERKAEIALRQLLSYQEDALKQFGDEVAWTIDPLRLLNSVQRDGLQEEAVNWLRMAEYSGNADQELVSEFCEEWRMRNRDRMSRLFIGDYLQGEVDKTVLWSFLRKAEHKVQDLTDPDFVNDDDQDLFLREDFYFWLADVELPSDTNVNTLATKFFKDNQIGTEETQENYPAHAAAPTFDVFAQLFSLAEIECLGGMER